jgi:hypothetical protein
MYPGGSPSYCSPRRAFLFQAELHSLDDPVDLKLIEGSLDAQHQTVVRIGGMVHTMLVCQQDIVVTAEADDLDPILVVADQARQFACCNEPCLVAGDGFQEFLELVPSVQRRSRASGVPIEHDDSAGGPAEGSDMLDHVLLSSVAFLVLADLVGTALPNIDEGGTQELQRNGAYGKTDETGSLFSGNGRTRSRSARGTYCEGLVAGPEQYRVDE